MKAWIPLIIALTGLVATAAARRRYRENLTAWLATHIGRTASSARARTLAYLGGMCLLAAVVVGVGVWAAVSGGDKAWVRIVCGIVVLVLYAPIATLGAPKMTKWQKGYDHALSQRGATAEAAKAAASVARVISGVGLLLALGALFLLAPAG